MRQLADNHQEQSFAQLRGQLRQGVLHFVGVLMGDGVGVRHADFGRALGFVETERAAEVSGSRFAYLMREAVLLELSFWDSIKDSRRPEDLEAYERQVEAGLLPGTFLDLARTRARELRIAGLG